MFYKNTEASVLQTLDKVTYYLDGDAYCSKVKYELNVCRIRAFNASPSNSCKFMLQNDIIFHPCFSHLHCNPHNHQYPLSLLQKWIILIRGVTALDRNFLTGMHQPE